MGDMQTFENMNTPPEHYDVLVANFPKDYKPRKQEPDARLEWEVGNVQSTVIVCSAASSLGGVLLGERGGWTINLDPTDIACLMLKLQRALMALLGVESDGGQHPNLLASNHTDQRTMERCLRAMAGDAMGRYLNAVSRKPK